MSNNDLRIVVLGASGLIANTVAHALLDQGFFVTAVARQFSAAQKSRFGDCALQSEIVPLHDQRLLVAIDQADIVLNCVGVLQGGNEHAVHLEFVQEILARMTNTGKPQLLVHVSIPGEEETDATSFSKTKRLAEEVIRNSSIPYVILRPGFVIAQDAYGGSALVRSIASLPIGLPDEMAARPFQVTDIHDISKTVCMLAQKWTQGQRDWRGTWDVMAKEETDLRIVISGFRNRFGGPSQRLCIPNWSLSIGARLADWVAQLGWRPPIRSTALAELRRGVVGNPGPWIDATGIEPRDLSEIMKALPSTVQEAWFARLYLLKSVIVVVLCIFWILSGLIALFPAYDLATGILTDRGLPVWLAAAITIISSLMDITIGMLIAWRRTIRVGLYLGIGVSIFYMIGAAILTPEMWIEPLGALVKTGPAIILMLVALAIDKDR